MSLALLLSACQAGIPTALPQASTQLKAAARSVLSQGVQAIREARFQQLDLNHDGVVSTGEVADRDLRLPGLISGFQGYDSNRDGQITLPEFLREDVLQFYADFYDTIIEENFFLSDLNRDRVLSGDERNELTQKLSAWPELKGGDRNGDQMIDYAEYLEAYLFAEARR